MTYLVAPQDYLQRARDHLLSGDAARLFYAAFELRCCIESRQADYVEALEKYKDYKVRPWRIGESARKLKDIWDDPKIAELVYTFGDKEFPTYFTPVGPGLARAAERELGPLMHVQPSSRKLDWLKATKLRLTEFYREAWIACRGEHIVPPIWNPRTREPHPIKLYVTEASKELVTRLTETAEQKIQFRVKIDYLDAPPPDWKCDI